MISLFGQSISASPAVTPTELIHRLGALHWALRHQNGCHHKFLLATPLNTPNVKFAAFLIWKPIKYAVAIAVDYERCCESLSLLFRVSFDSSAWLQNLLH